MIFQFTFCIPEVGLRNFSLHFNIIIVLYLGDTAFDQCGAFSDSKRSDRTAMGEASLLCPPLI